MTFHIEHKNGGAEPHRYLFSRSTFWESVSKILEWIRRI